MNKQRLMIEVTDEDIDRLQSQALMHGFLREEPRKRWTDKEKQRKAFLLLLLAYFMWQREELIVHPSVEATARCPRPSPPRSRRSPA